MKHRYLLSLSIVPLIGSLVGFSNKNNIQVDAYEKEKLPTEIKLSDCTENTIRSYYSDLNSLDNTERTAENLLKNLKPILSNGQKYYSYDENNGKDI